jgi:hypothetical protein
MDSTTTSRRAPGHHSTAAEASPRGSRGSGAAPDGGPDSADRARGAVGAAIVVLRNLDVVLVLLGAPVALALGAPVFGVLVGAGGWLLQRVLAVVDRRIIDRAAEPGSRLGLDFVEAFARIWLLAGAIIIAGVIGRHADGLAAAVLIFAAYSVALAVRVASGRPGGDER